MKCSKCGADNPDPSRFCGICFSPLGQESAPPDAPPSTKTQPPGVGFAPGLTVAGRYKILKEIGRGSMGVVYEADDPRLRRGVALKFLPGELTYDPEARERFIHEAQTASALDHPHICPIHEIAETESGQIYIAMALCRGESLRALIRHGPLDPTRALTIAAQVADGLAAAHEMGIIHRDIKPANILMTRDGMARIADFGVAKLIGEARLTCPGSTPGTAAYMSPEQVRGEDVDARTDLWSLGVVLYEMLAGDLPFRSAGGDSYAFAIVKKSPDFSRIPAGGASADCRAILEKALVKDPAKRFVSAGEMAAALNAAVAAHRRPSPASPRKKRRLNKIAVPAILTLAALAAAVAAGLPRKIAALLGFSGPSKGIHLTLLPMTILGGGKPEQGFADGMTELLRRKLGELTRRRPDSWVTPAEHLTAYEVRGADEAEAVLGSNVVIAGNIRITGNDLSLSLEISDPVKVKRLAESDSLANIATWQERIILMIAEAIGLAPGSADAAGLAAGSTTVPAAFASHVRGLGRLAGPDTLENAEAAVAALEETMTLDPSFAEAGVDLADAYWNGYILGKDEAMARKAEARARAVLMIDPRCLRAHLILGRILQGSGRNQEAVEEYEKARSIDPLSYDAQIQLGSAYDKMLRPAEAESAFRAALELRPNYWAAYGYLGYFYFYRGDFEKARDQFRIITELCPGSINGLNNLGGAIFKLGNLVEAEEIFERSNALRRNRDACSNLAVLYYFRGRYADAVTMNEAAIAFGVDYYLIWGNLADSYHFTPGNEANAARAYRKAVEVTERELAVDPTNPNVRSSLAVFLVKSGSTSRGVAEMTEALRLKPDDSTIVLKAVVVYELGGDRRRALDALREYVRLKGPLEEVVKEPFLAGLRRDPGYLEIMGKTAGEKNAKTAKTGNPP